MTEKHHFVFSDYIEVSMKIFAETQHLYMRAITDDDLEAMFELDSDPLVHRFLGQRPLKARKQSQQYIDHIKMQYQKYGVGRWAVIEKATGEFTGWSGLKVNFEDIFNGHENLIDVGYRLMPRYWGKGYATESGKAAVRYGFEVLGLDTIYGMTEPDHHASRRVLEKIGLTYVEDFVLESENLPLTFYKTDKPEAHN